MPYNRPNLPYISGDLPNNTRFTDITNSSPDNAVSAQIFDIDVNSAFDSINALEVVVNGIGAGILPGSDNPLNANKLPTTDGEGNISFVFINDTYVIPGSLSGISLAANAIGTNNLQNGCIQTSKVLDQAITQPKLGLLSVGTGQLQLLSVTDPIIASMNGSKIIGGTLPLSAISPSFASTKATQQAANSTVVYTNPAVQQYHPSAASFWCTFNGQAIGNPPLLAAFNVSSITRLGIGNFQINFIVPFTTVNYCITGSGYAAIFSVGPFVKLTTSCTILCNVSNTNVPGNPLMVEIVGFGAQ